MKKTLLLVLVFAVSAALAQGQFQIKKLPAGSPVPTLDGNVSEWPVDYFVDSLTGDSNAYAQARVSEPWQRSDFQMRLYCTYDDTKIYYAIEVVADDVIKNCNNPTSQCDCIKLNQLGKGTAMYIMMDGTNKPNPSCPWTVGTTFRSAVARNAQQLPTYEFWVDRETTAPFGAASYQLSPGTEEADLYPTTCDNGSSGCTDQSFLCVGAKGPVDKHDWASNPWDNAQYWPTWFLSVTEGPAIGVSAEKAALRMTAENISANPNPFTGSTTLSYKAQNAGKLSIYSVGGKLVKSFATNSGSHSLSWNGLDNSGKTASDGIYIARLMSGDKSLDTRLFLTR